MRVGRENYVVFLLFWLAAEKQTSQQLFGSLDPGALGLGPCQLPCEVSVHAFRWDVGQG